ncbi:X-Pro dipeptidase [Salimicrobium jeotgali]|uniref:X-Pro dipeptidase n=1 Tax=Salimicrobium jeotgali TaxID=1230341 RepID=K2GJU8_9BACI|nr:Xaa-Pro peptidase family protein [Salimicrobium jeotgali]AKG03449.1 X-Pro dipeptidase [Salimicrobium jeotgali]EKE30714.1 cobalt dependent X-Pro dipeptidase [Salimicrobium jeotgali]MBM7697157.1 Xaa-Pro dipeptidase [Salimicrobium jeotgali]
MNTSQRITQLREVLKTRNLDAAIIFNFENQYYFSGLKAITYSRPIILVVEENKQSLIIPKVEENHAKEKTDVDSLYIYQEVRNSSGESTDYKALFNDVLSKLNDNSKVGIEYSSLPTDFTMSLQSQGFEIEDIQQDVVDLRSIKSEEEIEAIKTSGDLVSGALKNTLENSSINASEVDIDYFGNQFLFNEISKKFTNSTLDYFVMSPSGIERTNMPHVFSNTRKLEEGDIIIHSRQVGLNGYRAECERTYFVGEPSEKQKEVFDVMLRAHNAALDFIKVGVTAKEVDEAALRVIREAGLEKYVSHRTGHGIGIGQHEEPYLRFDNDLELKAGMVFCIEPGIYVPGVGGFRHSDTVVLREDGTEIITEYPRELEQLIF